MEVHSVSEEGVKRGDTKKKFGNKRETKGPTTHLTVYSGLPVISMSEGNVPVCSWEVSGLLNAYLGADG